MPGPDDIEIPGNLYDPDTFYTNIGGNLTGTGQGVDYGESGGDAVSEMLGGKGWETRDKHKGITSPQWRGGQGWIKGLEGEEGMEKVYGQGWISPPGKTISEGYKLQNVTHPQNDAYWSEQMFRSKFYDPYLMEVLTEPLTSMGGPKWTGAQVGQAGPGTDFQEITYFDPIEDKDITGLVAAPESSSMQFDMDVLTDALSGAEEDWDDIRDRLTWEEGHEAYDESKKALDEAELQARLQRSELMTGKPEQYESARAVQARSGMAYSAPATSAETGLQEESATAMENPAQTVKLAKEQFAKDKQSAEDLMIDAQGAWEDAQREYYSGMSELASTTQPGGGGNYDNILTTLAGLEAAHMAMGKHPKELAKEASADRTTALADRGMYKEAANTPGILQMRTWMESSTGPRAFAQQMKAAMQGAYYDVGSENNGGE